MTTAAAGDDDRRYNVVKRALRHVSHFSVKALIVVVLLDLVIWALPSENPWSWAFTALVLGLMSGVVGGRVLHEVMWPCDYCAARFPLDASAEAEKKHFWLRANHNKRYTHAWVALFLWSIIGAYLLGPKYGLQWPEFPAALVTQLPALTVLVVVTKAQIVHQKLQPWCPICRHRDEWDDPIDIPVPTPPSAKVDA